MLALATVLALMAGTAAANFPGKNGVIAFTARGDAALTPDWRGIETIDPLTGERATINEGGSAPAWSADGRRLAYTAADGVHVANVDGSGDVALGFPGGEPSWSPDGTQLAVAAADGIWIVPTDGDQARRVVAGDHPGRPSWSPDGSRIAVVGSIGLVIAAADGSDLRHIASAETWPESGDPFLPAGQYLPADPDWSPDGREIVYAMSWTDGPCENCGLLYRISASGGTPTRVPGSTSLRSPSWSPDGTKVVGVESEGIHIVDLATGSRQRLLAGSLLALGLPAWQPRPHTFTGFAAPVDQGGVTRVKVGQSIPLRYHLSDWHGAAIESPSSFAGLTTVPTSSACGGAPAEAVEASAGASGLQHLGDGHWQYTWTPPKSYAGQCRTLVLKLDDGTVHEARFEFLAEDPPPKPATPSKPARPSKPGAPRPRPGEKPSPPQGNGESRPGTAPGAPGTRRHRIIRRTIKLSHGCRAERLRLSGRGARIVAAKRLSRGRCRLTVRAAHSASGSRSVLVKRGGRTVRLRAKIRL